MVLKSGALASWIVVFGSVLHAPGAAAQPVTMTPLADTPACCAETGHAAPGSLATTPRWLIAPHLPGRAAPAPEAGGRLTFTHPQTRPWLEDVARRSPWLRQQLDRLERDERLTMSVDVKPRVEGRHRALTQLESRANGLHARVTIVVEARTVELIGHEFEHIIEHLEGVRVEQRLRRKDAGVRSSAEHQYETERALLAGRQVLGEYLRSLQGGSR